MSFKKVLTGSLLLLKIDEYFHEKNVKVFVFSVLGLLQNSYTYAKSFKKVSKLPKNIPNEL